MIPNSVKNCRQFQPAK